MLVCCNNLSMHKLGFQFKFEKRSFQYASDENDIYLNQSFLQYVLVS